jgi:hypothetical protein
MVAAFVHRQLVVINVPRPQRDTRSLNREAQIGLIPKRRFGFCCLQDEKIPKPNAPGIKSSVSRALQAFGGMAFLPGIVGKETGGACGVCAIIPFLPALRGMVSHRGTCECLPQGDILLAEPRAPTSNSLRAG